MFHKASENIFKEDALPRAYYMPSLEKELSRSAKKTCLSPLCCTSEEITQENSNYSEQFLHESNKVEIPTREDGTAPEQELSSGSKFDETWPSTERNVSDFSQTTPQSLSSLPLQKKAEEKHAAFSSHAVTTDCSSKHSTLSKFVERFRHGAPTSRKDRYLPKSHGEFWWLSPPSSTSTPKETSDACTINFSGRSGDSYQDSSSTSPPVQAYGYHRDHILPPAKGVAKNTKSTNLSACTNRSIEKSDDTSSPSFKSVPKLSSKWMVDRDKVIEEGSQSRKPKGMSHLAPEDDILYQWRLSRRLEKAQQLVKGFHARKFEDYSSRVVNECLSLQKHHSFRGNNVKQNSEMIIPNSANCRVHDESRPQDQTFLSHNQIMARKNNVSWSQGNESKRRCVDAEHDPLEKNVPAVCFIDKENIPSHVHMLCDVMPCVKKNFAVDRAYVTKETQTEIFHKGDGDLHASSMNVRKRGENNLQSSENIVCVQNSAVSKLKDLDEEKKVAQPVHPDDKLRPAISLECTSRGTHETDMASSASSTFGVHVAWNSGDRQASSERVEINGLSNVKNKSYENQTLCKKDLENVPNKKADLELRNDELVSHRNEEHATVNCDEKSNRNTCIKEKDSGRYSLPQTSVQSSTTDTALQSENDGVIGTIIGQVISERLFSSLSSSQRSDCSTIEECNNDVQEKVTVQTREVLFPDDDILIQLRQQAKFYETHLKNIDAILAELTD